MSAIIYYILSLTEFILVISVGIALVSIGLYYMSNKFNLKFINVYGFFSSMDEISLLMLTSAILKEITLVYCVVKISSFSMILLYIFSIYCFAYAFFTFKVTAFIKELVVGAVEYLIIFFLSLLSSFLVEVRYSEMVKYYIFILSAILISCSIFFFARNLSFILANDKNVRRNLIEKNY